MEDVDVVVADVLHGVDESLTGEAPGKAGNVSIGDVLDVANSSKGAHSRYLVEICKASSKDIWNLDVLQIWRKLHGTEWRMQPRRRSH